MFRSTFWPSSVIIEFRKQ